MSRSHAVGLTLHVKELMNTRSNHNLAILMAFTILLAIACNSGILFPKPTPSTMEPKLLHFENDIVAFDYPAGVRIYTANDPAFNTYPGEIRFGGELVVGLADPHWIKRDILYSSIGIHLHPIPPGSSLDEILETTYKNIWNGNEVTEDSGPVTIDGLAAYQKTYKVASGPLWYTLRDIWVEKDGVILRLALHEEVYAPDFQPIAELFLNSLDIKDNLPPFEIKPTVTPTLTPTPFPASMLRHFENDVVAFDYLDGLNVYEAGNVTFLCYPDFQLGGELVVGLGDPKFIKSDRHHRSIRIFSEKMPHGSNLETVMYEAYLLAEVKFPHEKGVVNATGLVTVTGLSAYQWTYQVHSGEAAYELRDVWIPKDGELFIITIWTEYTNPEDFAVFQAGADVLLESLRIK
jgi:energy-converting hydrogenase Eha subunit F